jgi:hypothetical protein
MRLLTTRVGQVAHPFPLLASKLTGSAILLPEDIENVQSGNLRGIFAVECTRDECSFPILSCPHSFVQGAFQQELYYRHGLLLPSAPHPGDRLIFVRRYPGLFGQHDMMGSRQCD